MWELAAGGSSVVPLATFRSSLRVRISSMDVDKSGRVLLAGDMNGNLMVFDATVPEFGVERYTVSDHRPLCATLHLFAPLSSPTLSPTLPSTHDRLQGPAATALMPIPLSIYPQNPC